jgi:hypothetical protein
MHEALPSVCRTSSPSGQTGGIKKAAEQGDAGAQKALGEMYLKGLGFPKNSREAVKWYRKAALQGDAKAQANGSVQRRG